MKCKSAAEAITKIIEEGLTQPDSENQLRRDQLMELAQLNGTIRDMGLRFAFFSWQIGEGWVSSWQ